MHVLKPSEIAKRKKREAKKRRRKVASRSLLLIAIVASLAGIGQLYFSDELQTIASRFSAEQSDKDDQPTYITQESNNVETELPHVLSATKKTGNKLLELSGIQFRDLYRSIHYPNAISLAEPVSITGNQEADSVILRLAKARGFELTAVPNFPIQQLDDEEYVAATEDNLLQPLAKESWLHLRHAAATDGIDISIISGYRSIDRQRELFMDRLLSTGITVEQIAAGLGESILDDVLSLTAVPGYSRHHTGYTIDLYCGDGNAFGASVCNQWISANNYENAKRYGWIPSYPPGGGLQGPEPEPWEFVWVGEQTLLAN